MKGRIEKIPSVTSARVANVQKKSFERKAWKKAIRPGTLGAARTETTLLPRTKATTGQSGLPSDARRIAESAMSAIRNATPQTTAAKGKSPSPLLGEVRANP